MSGAINLDVLARDEVRTAILLTEIGGWLHMLGKMDNKFIFSQAVAPSCSYEERDISDLWQSVHSKFCGLLTVNAASPLNLSVLTTAPTSLDLFVKQHRKDRSHLDPPEEILRILRDAHGQASGTEKGTLPKPEGKQTTTYTFPANAFGYEDSKKNLVGKLDDLRIKKHDSLGKSVIESLEEALKKILSSSVSETEWKDLYYRLKTVLGDTLSETVGDTRRPANEVTLWDQTVTAASLLKTGLVQNVLGGSRRDPLVNTFANKYRWRFLRIHYDGLTFIANAHHPTDLRGRWQALQDAQETIRRLLEVTYPLAAEAYRDEANLVFVVPDLPDLLKATLSYQGTTITLKDWIRNMFASELQDELEPQVWLNEKPSRGAINLGQTLREELSSPQPNPIEMNGWWSGAIDESCTVCRVRPQGYGSGNAQKARRRNVCCVCLERREKRSRGWANDLSEATIWIDEAADQNGRVALIAGKFDLTGWFDGKYFGSFTGRKLPSDAGISPAAYSAVISSLATRDLSQANLNSTTCLKAMQQNTNIPNLPPASIYEVLVTERDQDGIAPSPASADYDCAARHLFRGFFGKTTSFARLRRIWETTGEFWDNARKALGDLASKQKYRLILQGQLSEGIGPSHAYDVRVGKVETSFVWDGTRLISADNLRYLAKQLNLDLSDKNEDKAVAEAVSQKLQEFNKLELFEKPSRQGQPVRVAVLSEFSVVLEEHNYSPVIPLLAEPQIFIALVPADKAMTVITHLRDEYERQMSKVRNRLSLHLNLLTFNRRVPLYVAMDAVRRMLDRKTDSTSQWRVVDPVAVGDSAGKLGKHAMWLKLAPSSGNQWLSQQITAGISYNLSDDSKDFYYPYFFVTQTNEDKANGGKPLTERPHHWQAIHPKYNPTTAHGFTDLVHVSELCKDDIVLYSSSTFDFEHLDVAGRRFELNYDESGVRVASANRQHPSTRPFLLDEIADLENVWGAMKKLPGGQRDFLVRLIETKRTEWKATTADDPILRRLACDTLKQTGAEQKWWTDKLDNEQRRLLEEWAANGRLADVLELYEEMMKLEVE